MKVAVDTNILFSALMFPGSFSAQVFYSIMERYDLVLSTYVLDEIREVIHRKLYFSMMPSGVEHEEQLDSKFMNLPAVFFYDAVRR